MWLTAAKETASLDYSNLDFFLSFFGMWVENLHNLSLKSENSQSINTLK